MLRKSLVFLTLLALVIGSAMAQGNSRRGQNGKGGGFSFDGGMESLLSGLPLEELNAAEIRALRLMREEEKLARDVYLTLFEDTNFRIFRNIARSEQRHMNAVRILIQKYGLADPASDDTVGVFTNPNLQALYYDLTAQGSQSLQEALQVGALIEDLDIFDLKRFIKKSDNQDILVLLQNLQKGSRNHIRSFIRQMTRFQLEYSARYLGPEELEEILNSPMERGLYDADGKPYFGSTGW
jgi:hypothetical protein